MKEFVRELSATFPEHEALQVFDRGFDAFIALDPSKPLTVFMDALNPHGDLIMARDNALFEQEIDMGGYVDLHSIWKTENLSDTTRSAIWQYISTLFLLGTTVQNMPAELLSSIETMAQDCASKIENGELDVNDITSNLMKSMSGLMGTGGLAQLANGFGCDLKQIEDKRRK